MEPGRLGQAGENVFLFAAGRFLRIGIAIARGGSELRQCTSGSGFDGQSHRRDGEVHVSAFLWIEIAEGNGWRGPSLFTERDEGIAVCGEGALQDDVRG